MNHWKEEPQVHRYWYPIRYLMWHTPHPDTEHLTEDFGIFLEDALMEQVQENPPKGDDIEQVFSDWQRLLPCYDGSSVNGPAISLCTNMHRYTGTAMEYLDFRARLWRTSPSWRKTTGKSSSASWPEAGRIID